MSLPFTLLFSVCTATADRTTFHRSMTVILAAGYLYTGQSNELWSYGEENYRIMKKYYDIRISMHDYIKQLYDEASENGSPLIRTMFYEFPVTKNAGSCRISICSEANTW